MQVHQLSLMDCFLESTIEWKWKGVEWWHQVWTTLAAYIEAKCAWRWQVWSTLVYIEAKQEWHCTWDDFRHVRKIELPQTNAVSVEIQRRFIGDSTPHVPAKLWHVVCGFAIMVVRSCSCIHHRITSSFSWTVFPSCRCGSSMPV